MMSVAKRNEASLEKENTSNAQKLLKTRDIDKASKTM